MLDSVDEWSLKHAEELERLGMFSEAELCRNVPKYPAKTFREALQSFYFQYICVMRENPFGGNSPGRLDYYLWPYLEADLAENRCTLDEARELIEELFIRIDERIHPRDTWVETVVVGGSHPGGASSVNPLSYIMIEAIMKYNITHPMVCPRFPKTPPEDFVKLSAKFVVSGNNRAQIVNDESIMNALVLNGTRAYDAANFGLGGCMEVGIQGATSDFLFTGFYSIPKYLELCITGGFSLSDKVKLKFFSPKPLTEFSDFESFYSSFLSSTKTIIHKSLKYIDILSEHAEKTRPGYLISSMIDDCIERGRNMQGGGARYHDYGAAIMGIPNAADSLYAIKRAVFDEKICTAEELISALKADFSGYEELEKKLREIPKYGMEDKEADLMMSRVLTDVSTIYGSYVNRFGGCGKLVILTFVWSPVVGKMLGATPDGRRAGVPIAHGVTPQGVSMKKGITAAINSCASLPFDVCSGGASTMWDLDVQIAKPEIVEALIRAFFDRGGQFFQGNMTDIEELLDAQLHPEKYASLIVRVGGYSARFTGLSKELQDEIINRYRHKN